MTVTSPAATTPDLKPAAGRGPRSTVLRTLLRNRLAVVALAVLAILLIAAIFAPLLAPYDPGAQDLLLRLKPPAWQSGGDSAAPARHRPARPRPALRGSSTAPGSPCWSARQRRCSPA